MNTKILELASKNNNADDRELGKLCSELEEHYVYKLFREGEVVYVGSSKTPLVRIVVHENDKHFDTVLIRKCVDYHSMLDYENTLILKFMPVYNKSSKLSKVTEEVCCSNWMTVFEYLESKCVVKSADVRAAYKLGYTFIGDTKYVSDQGKSGTKDSKNIIMLPGSSIGFRGRGVKPTEAGSEAPDYKKYEIRKGVYKVGKIVFTSNGKWKMDYKNQWYQKPSVEECFKFALESLKKTESVVKGDLIPMGKYKGRTVVDVLAQDKDYLQWAAKAWDSVLVDKLGIKEALQNT